MMMLAAGSCLARGHTLLRDKDWSAQSGHLHGRSTLEAPRGQRGCITVQRLHSPLGSAGPELSHCTCARGLGSGSVGHREPSRKPRGRPTPASRESQSCRLYLQTLESFGRESPQDCDIFLLPLRRAKPKIGRGCPLRCLFSLRDQGPERGFRVAAPQPTFRALPALTAGQAPRGWRALLPSPPALAPSSQSHPPRRSGSFRRVGAFLPHVCRQHPSHAASLALPPALLLLAF